MEPEEISSGDDPELLRRLEEAVKESRSFRKHQCILQRRAQTLAQREKVRRMFFLARQSFTAAHRRFEDLRQNFHAARLEFASSAPLQEEQEEDVMLQPAAPPPP
jgi:hypothetical protein